jgi:hypothetical protein
MQTDGMLRVTFGSVFLALSLILLGLTLPTASNSQAPITASLSSGTQTRLANGDVLLINGKAAILDPNTGQIKRSGSDLTHTRSWHTATLLPDATVLIVGGIDPAGHVISDPEIFDPEKQTFESVLNSRLSARAYHSATLLTDGTVLLAGGISEAGTPLNSAEIWDYRTRTGGMLEAEMLSPRLRPIARLLSDGSVLLSGGVQATDPTRIKAEVYSPSSRIFQPSYGEPHEPGTPIVEGSVPENRATDVATDAIVGVRFSSRMQAGSLSAATVALLDDSLAHHDAGILAAEQGMLLFITPKSPLAPSTRYTIAINGAKDLNGNSAFATLSFTTVTPSSLQENRLITTTQPAALAHLRAGIVHALDAPNPTDSKTIKAFMNCLNATLAADGKNHTVADTVPVCIPGQSAPNTPICQFVVTMSEQSQQRACISKNKDNPPQEIEFPRVILDCPGATNPFRFRPSYNLCPLRKEGGLDSVEIGYDLKQVGFKTGVNIQKPGPNPNTGTMMMGNIDVPRHKAFPKLEFGSGEVTGIVSFAKVDGDLTGTINCNKLCHQPTNSTKNTEVPFPPINPFDSALVAKNGKEVNLAKRVKSTNITDNNAYPGANMVPAAAVNSTKQFSDICTAIEKNEKNMADVEPATMSVVLKLCKNLLNVVNLGK